MMGAKFMIIAKIMVEEGVEVVTGVVVQDHMEVMEQQVRRVCVYDSIICPVL